MQQIGPRAPRLRLCLRVGCCRASSCRLPSGLPAWELVTTSGR
jgi:hypothetical protein